MRKKLAGILGLALLLPLNGCIFAVGAEDWEWDDHHDLGSRVTKLEKRVADLEKSCAACAESQHPAP